jgi:hypothetical protein
LPKLVVPNSDATIPLALGKINGGNSGLNQWTFDGSAALPPNRGATADL